MVDSREHAHGDEHNPEVAHETSDINVRAFLWWTVGFIVFAVVTHVGLYFLFDFFRTQQEKKQEEPQTMIRLLQESLPPEPRLQSDPPADLKLLREQEREILSTYAAEPGGKVRIPIEQAMEMIVREGASVGTASRGKAVATPAMPPASPTITPPPTGAPAAPVATPGPGLTTTTSADAVSNPLR